MAMPRSPDVPMTGARSPGWAELLQPARYDLTVPADDRRILAFSWLLLAVAALAASGIFSVLLVVSRTPGVKELLPVADFFRVTLVAHVDLSVLVWFLALAAMLWSFAGEARAIALGKLAVAVAGLGTLAMTMAPFVERATPIMANYVPVLHGKVFIAGLVLFAVGILIAAVRGMALFTPVGPRISGEGALRFGLNASLAVTGLAAFALVASFVQLDRALAPETYYELLFWGPGHVLQFTYTLLMLVGWAWLASAIGAPLPLTPRVVILLFAIALASAFLTPFIYLAPPVASVEHAKLHTWLMRFGGGLAVAPFALALAWGLAATRVTYPAKRVLRACLASSFLLFAAGGLIGFAISGSNVRVPAHYHGAIVGVTLALMGLTYLLLPRFGYPAPASRLAIAQPWLYAAGQFLHIVGLMVSGGYGVQRKVAGAEQVLRSTPEVIGMGVMGFGGLIAIIGGLAFLVVVAKSLLRRP
jgi:hypothetical protein